MTITKMHSPDSDSSHATNSKGTYATKATRKRSVSFSMAVDSRPKRASDNRLQSSDKKRKYMRRGSRSASMLLLAMQRGLGHRQAVIDEKHTHGHQQRRLSLVSALKVSLENTSIIDANDEPCINADEASSSAETRTCACDVVSEFSDDIM